MARRFDTVAITAAGMTRTPAGGLVIPAALTRVGVFEYPTHDGKIIREYRPREEVFKATSLATYDGATVTELHPSSPVNPDNWRTLTRGRVVEGSLGEETPDHITARIAVEDANTVRKIERRELVELSCGYDCDIDETPGVAPTGEAYDRVQRNIVVNHVALGPGGWGRAGSSVCLRLDSRGNLQTTTTGKNRARNAMKFPKIERRGRYLRIDGKSHDLRSREGRASARAQWDALRKTVTRADGLEETVGTLREALDKAVEAFNTLADEMVPAEGEDATEDGETPAEKTDEDAPAEKTDEDAPADPEAKKDAEAEMDKRADARATVIVKALSFLPKLTTTGKSTEAIQRETLTAARVRHDGMSRAEVAGAFAAVKPHKSHPSLGQLNAATQETARTDSGGDSAETVEHENHKRARDKWKTPATQR